ncbi:MAG: HAMP domain-containing sensor histidine kinase [Acidimicrobiales bacterium]|jgi:signal transduction histidine kinase
MRRRLLAGFLLFALALVVVLEVPLGLSLARNDRITAMAEVQRDATSLSVLVAAGLNHTGGPSLQAVISQFARAEDAIVAVVSNGNVLASAGKDADEELADPRTKPIIIAAAAGHTSGEEGSNDPDDDFLYMALPVAVSAPRAKDHLSSGHGPDVVLLVAESAAPLHARIRNHWIALALFGIGVLALATAIGTLLARSLTRPLETIEAAVAAVGAGRLSERARVGRAPGELKALGETVDEMADRLEELVHTQRAFLADASHQLRTPLTALRLRLENLEETLEPEQRADLAPALAEADRLSRIVDGLLTLARAEGGARPTREVVEVGTTLRDRADAWSALAEERQVALTCDPATGAGEHVASLRALACPGHLEQVLDNLLANALEATHAGGTVSLGAVHVGDHIEVHVIDDGPGMSPADRTRAFDRFWRHEGAPSGGTGLGLAIVSQLARMSGGTAWLDAAPNGGVDAVIRLEAGRS